jgi:hypothetical protein
MIHSVSTSVVSKRKQAYSGDRNGDRIGKRIAGKRDQRGEQ